MRNDEVINIVLSIETHCYDTNNNYFDELAFLFSFAVTILVAQFTDKVFGPKRMKQHLF